MCVGIDVGSGVGVRRLDVLGYGHAHEHGWGWRVRVFDAWGCLGLRWRSGLGVVLRAGGILSARAQRSAAGRACVAQVERVHALSEVVPARWLRALWARRARRVRRSRGIGRARRLIQRWLGSFVLLFAVRVGEQKSLHDAPQRAFPPSGRD